MGHDLVGGWFTFEIDFGNDGFLFFYATPKGSQPYLTCPASAYANRLDRDSKAPVPEISDVGFQADFPVTSLPEVGQASGVAFRISGRSGSLGVQDLWEFLGTGRARQ